MCDSCEWLAKTTHGLIKNCGRGTYKKLPQGVKIVGVFLFFQVPAITGKNGRSFIFNVLHV